MLNIAFRADGGENIGMGHIMRCLSLARAFRRKGHTVYFVSKLTEGISRVSSENFAVVPLPSVAHNDTEGFFYGNPALLSDEAAQLIQIVKDYQIDVLILDSYNVTEEYFLTLKPYVRKLAYIDDVNKFTYPVDILINGNITGEYLGYSRYNKDQVLLLGPTYNMIREEFLGLTARVVKDKITEVMITVGGADPYDVTGKMLDIILSSERYCSVRLNVIVGGSFTSLDRLIKLKHKYTNVFLYGNFPEVHNYTDIVYSEMSDVMLRSDIALSAGGSTLYELAACGTPTLAFILADNQEFIVGKMSAEGYIKSLGWYNGLTDQAVLAALKELEDAGFRQRLSQRGQALVDGRGTARIVRAIEDNLVT
jgi:UDP-2,4-diacetamido-2,4,6-trideoxy-beta-L-altropyranose hydrolase